MAAGGVMAGVTSGGALLSSCRNANSAGPCGGHIGPTAAQERDGRCNSPRHVRAVLKLDRTHGRPRSRNALPPWCCMGRCGGR